MNAINKLVWGFSDEELDTIIEHFNKSIKTLTDDKNNRSAEYVAYNKETDKQDYFRILGMIQVLDKMVDKLDMVKGRKNRNKERLQGY